MIINQSISPEFTHQEMRQLCQHYLHLIYHTMLNQGISEGKRHFSETQGEILYPSIEKLFSIIPLTKNDIFFDLGSGLGKIVAQVFLQSEVKEAIGIEIVPELHHKAQFVAQLIEKELPAFYQNNRKLMFLEGDFLQLSFSRATVVLINATCFSQKMLTQLGKIIENTPTIHSVLTLRPLHTLTRLSFQKAIRIECSWDSALCYLYY